MGVEVAAVSAGLALYQGVSGYIAAQEEADALNKQADITAKETVREAKRIREDGLSFVARQKVAALSSGITLEGSPLLMLADTKYKVEEQATALEQRGVALSELGHEKADRTARTGRWALFGGVLSAGATAYDKYSVFNTPKKEEPSYRSSYA